MTRNVSYALAAASLLAACAQEAPPTPAVTPVEIAIENVSVVDVASGRLLGPHTIAIDDGVITEIWPVADAPADLAPGHSIDGTGRFLIPGLWDSHVHFRGGEALVEDNKALLPLYPLNGITTVRDGGGDITEHLLGWRDAIDAGNLLGPRIFTSGPKLDGPEAMWEGSITIADPAGVPAAIDALQAMGVDYVKLYNGSMSAEVYLAAIRETESRGIKVMGHTPDDADILEAIAAGVDGFDHMDAVYQGTNARRDLLQTGQSRLVVAQQLVGQRDPAREKQVFAAMVEQGTVIVPTLHISWLVTEYARTDFSGSPELAYIPAGIRATYAMRVDSAKRAQPDKWAIYESFLRDMPNLIPAMNAAGVTILAGSDAGPFNSYCFPGFCLHTELERLVEAGMTPAEVLRSATMAPATFMGRGDSLGQVAKGYEADLVLLEENPLEDIRATRSVDAVILRGRTVLDRAALDATWQELNQTQ